jgi:hypothetical protein
MSVAAQAITPRCKQAREPRAAVSALLLPCKSQGRHPENLPIQHSLEPHGVQHLTAHFAGLPMLLTHGL